MDTFTAFWPKRNANNSNPMQMLGKAGSLQTYIRRYPSFKKKHKGKKKSKKVCQGFKPPGNLNFRWFRVLASALEKKNHGKGSKCICSSVFLLVLHRPRLHRCKADPRKMCSKSVNLNQTKKKAKKKKCWGGGLANHFLWKFFFSLRRAQQWSQDLSRFG